MTAMADRTTADHAQGARGGVRVRGPAPGPRGDPPLDQGAARVLSGVLDLLDQAVVALDRDFRVTLWSAAAERRFGRRAAEVLGRPAREVALIGGDVPLAALEHGLRELGHAETTVRGRGDVDGDLRLVAVAVGRHPDGGPAGYVAMHRAPVPDRRPEAGRTGREAVLRDAERRLDVVVEGVTDAFSVLDDQLRWTSTNTRTVLLLHDLTGLTTSCEALIGRCVADVLPGFGGSDIEGRMRTAVHEQRAAVLQLEARGRWFDLHVSPALGGTTVAVRDVTAHRRAGADRRRRRDQQTALTGLAHRAAVGEPGALTEDVARSIAGVLDADLALVAERVGPDGGLEVVGLAGSMPGAVAQLLGPEALGPTIERMTAARGAPELVVDPARLGPALSAAVVAVDPARAGPRRVIVAAMRRPRTFEADEVDVVASVADVLSLAGARAARAPTTDDRRIGAVDRSRRGDTDCPPCRLMLVQDHTAMREALSAALLSEDDVGDVRQARSVAEARAGVDDVDVVLVDLALPGGGAELVGELRARNPDVGVLVLASDPDGTDAATAVERGAAGVLSTDTHLRELVEAVRRVRRGEELMPLEDVVRMLRLARRSRERGQDERRRVDGLSPREREVLQLLASGVEHRRAATRLHVSPRTHRNHVANILAKLGVHSQLQAVLFAVRHGAVEVGDPDRAA